MTAQIEDIILKNMIYSDDFIRSSLPHLKSEYFSEESHKYIFEAIQNHMADYNKRPTTTALDIVLQKHGSIGERAHEEINNKIKLYEDDTLEDHEWLLAETEQWCKNRSVANAVFECINILQGEDKTLTVDAMPDILKDALAVSFDQSIGHDFLDDAEDRYEYYTSDVERIPFKLSKFNDITSGGVPNKTLNVLMAGTGGFKSGAMCSFAADYLMDGLDVLYITLEMAEERIAERIDANLLDVPLDDLSNLTHEQYMNRISKVRDKTQGRLIIKEYPSASVNVTHFKHLLRELELKKNFKPKVIFIDYVNIATSSRVTLASGSYGYIKAIAEEFRGMAVEFNVPIWTATQTNRDGYNSDEVDLTNTSESFGLPATADFFAVLVNDDDLNAQGLLKVKQLKNRYGPLDRDNTFLVCKEGANMRLSDADQNDVEFNQESINNDVTKNTSDTEFNDLFGSAPDKKEKLKNLI